MGPQDFHYDLPAASIAAYPLPIRSASRLLHLDGGTGAIRHGRFQELARFLHPADLLVFNDVRVAPARLYGCRESGGRMELLLERVVQGALVSAQLRGARGLRRGARFLLRDGPQGDRVVGELRLEERQGDLWLVDFSAVGEPGEVLKRYGRAPLPPYIKRPPEEADRCRYQTVYAARGSAVAAPTAGLHFDVPLLQQLADVGIQSAFVTLHVGMGTFQPVRCADIRRHPMHAEEVEVSAAVCRAVEQTRRRGGRVIAVGTTTVRSLETAAQDGCLRPLRGETRLFIYPGYRFRCVDALISNFHAPRSSLLMLVSALAGREKVLRAYREALGLGYRFLSYGDAMFLQGDPKVLAGQG